MGGGKSKSVEPMPSVAERSNCFEGGPVRMGAWNKGPPSLRSPPDTVRSVLYPGHHPPRENSRRTSEPATAPPEPISSPPNPRPPSLPPKPSFECWTHPYQKKMKPSLKDSLREIEQELRQCQHDRAGYRRKLETLSARYEEERVVWVREMESTKREGSDRYSALEARYEKLKSTKEDLDVEMGRARSLLALEDKDDLSRAKQGVEDLNRAVDDLAFLTLQSLARASSAAESQPMSLYYAIPSSLSFDGPRNLVRGYTHPTADRSNCTIEQFYLALLRSFVNGIVDDSVLSRYRPLSCTPELDYVLDSLSSNIHSEESQQRAAAWRTTTFDALDRLSSRSSDQIAKDAAAHNLVTVLHYMFPCHPGLGDLTWCARDLSKIVDDAVKLHRLFQRGFMSTNLHLLYFPHSSISHSFDATRMESSENDVEDGTAASKVGAGTGLICLATTAFGLEQSTRKETSPGGFVTERTVLMKAKVETMRSLG